MILAALAAAAAAPMTLAAAATVERRTTVRVVRARRAPSAPPPLPDYKVRHGPHCLAAADVSGAAVTGPAQVDFALRGGQRVRAELEDECPALDFYRGFYLSPSADGKICADRDMVRTRSGAECAIDRFRRLEPREPEKTRKP